MNAISFGTPEWFWGLLALPLLALLFERAERRAIRRLRDFASERLLPRLTGTVNRFRRALQFGLLLATLGFALVALAQPRWGYTYDEVKRKGVDLIFAVDTSRSMLSNDVQPSRLERVKLAAQDLVNELRGDRVGLIAFAGRAFLQAPLTIDYGAAIDSINDLDTSTIPEGGTNISDAISLAARTYGKSAVGNRALIIFTDGEELSGDATKTAKAAADAGVRIFTVGVGTPEGSLIPIKGDDGGTAFVKDAKGQVVKSKLDEKRLREIAEATGGFYLHLENGPRTMQQLFTDGLSKLQAADIDERLSRRPIERFEWPIAAALLTLVTALLINDRKRAKAPSRVRRVVEPAMALLLVSAAAADATSPGLDYYQQQKFPEAYQQFEQTLKENPNTRATDKIQFDAGAAAYKMKDYSKALESFSQALLSTDASLQARSHYNLGNTLYERGEAQKADAKKLTDWENALQHYEQTLKTEPQNKEAKENYEFVKKKIEELKNKQQQSPTPTPTLSPSPSPSPNENKDKKQDQQQQQDKQQQQQQSKEDQKQKQDQQQQQQKDQSQQKSDSKDGKEQKPDDKSGSNKDKQEQQSGSPTPSPSPGENEQQGGASPSPSPSAGEKSDDKSEAQPSPGEQPPNESPTPAEGSEASPSPSAGENGEGENGNGASPTATPSDSPGKKLTGEVKGAPGEKPPDKEQEPVEVEAVKEGEMNEQQARLLLQAMKDEEQKVQLDERKAARRVYNDW